MSRVLRKTSLHKTYPHVDFRSGIMLAAKDFGSSVGRATAPRAQSFPWGESVTEAEIGDFHVHLGIEQQVLRFQITMRHTRHMAIFDRGEYLSECCACPGLSHSSVSRYVVEYLTFARVLAHLRQRRVTRFIRQKRERRKTAATISVVLTI